MSAAKLLYVGKGLSEINVITLLEEILDIILACRNNRFQRTANLQQTFFKISEQNYWKRYKLKFILFKRVEHIVTKGEINHFE